MRQWLWMMFAVVAVGSAAPLGAQTNRLAPDGVRASTKTSLVHLGMFDIYDMSADDRLAATLIVTALQNKDPALLQQAIGIYKRITTHEDFGGEATGLLWLCEYLTAAPPAQAELRRDPYVNAYAQFFTTNDCAVLKEYLNRRYRFEQVRDADPNEAAQRRGLLDDLVRFNNPRREAWENTARVMDLLPVKAGDAVVDMDGSPGFYTVRLARRVGAQGHVYAPDIRQKHVEYLTGFVAAGGLTNVQPIRTRMDNLAVSNAVDLVFMGSYYQAVYATCLEPVKDRFIASIRRVLKPDGTLAILNDALLENPPLRRYGSYMAKELIISQLKFYGFRLAAYHQVTPQRYLLLFKRDDAPGGATGDITRGADAAREFLYVPGGCAGVTNGWDTDCIPIASHGSLVHLGSLDSFDITEGGKRAARYLLTAIEKNDRESARMARDIYERLIPDENFGGEYTALAWFCDYLTATDQARPALLNDRHVASYFKFFAAKDFATLKEYLMRKYHLEQIVDQDPEAGHDREAFLEDFILFNNPRRESWERTSKIIGVLNLKPGDAVADIGCGPGYYTFKFADLVGPSGRVYALDTNDKHVEYVAGLVGQYGISNVVPLVSQYNSICVTNPVDLAFMCSLYHIIYATSSEQVKDEFVASIAKALKPDGTLVVADNSLVEDTTLPYHGPYIAKELVIAQLRHYGFRLVAYHQFIPQRYVLIFKKAAAPSPAAAH